MKLFTSTKKRDQISRIRCILKLWKEDLDKDNWLQYIPFEYNRGILTLYTIKPGIIIGLHGATINDLRELLKSKLDGFKDVKVKEIKTYAA